MEKYLTALPELVLQDGLNLLTALIIFVVGRWTAGRLTLFLSKFLDHHRVEPTLTKFVTNLAYYALWTFVLLAALGRLGIQTTSLVAVLGAAGLAVGLALQGSLSNFAAGVLIIIFRPFRVGDTVNIGSILGTVKEIQIFDTVLSTPNNVLMIVPNSKITGEPIQNFSAHDKRRLELVVGVSYAEDLKKVRRVLEEVVRADPRILKEPACVIGVKDLGESSVNVTLFPWVKTADFGAVSNEIFERIKNAFDQNGITIPFPQRDVRLIPQAAATVK